MTDENRSEYAVNAYVKFMQTKGIGADIVALRTKFLKKLVIFLKGKSTKEEFGKALNTILIIEDNISRHQQLNIAREFYPFWIGDVKLIAAMSASYGFDLDAIQFKPMPTPLEWATIEELGNAKFEEHEVSLLSRYSDGLLKKNLVGNALETKIKLVKVILLRLRDLPVKNNLAYRLAVDVTLPLFIMDDLKQRFLQVVREFFYIWMDHPAAKPKLS